MINRYVREYRNSNEFSEEFKLQLINTTLYVFLNLPKEMLPVLSLLFQSVFEKKKESHLILQKCQNYFSLIKKDVHGFQQVFKKFFEEENFKVQENQQQDLNFNYLNNFSVIYQKPEDTFTKSKEFFQNQRNQAFVDPEPKNTLDMDEDLIEEQAPKTNQNNENGETSSESDSEEEEPVPQKEQEKQVSQNNNNNDEIDFLGLDLGGVEAQVDFGIEEIKFEPKKKEKKKQKKIVLAPFEMDPAEFQQKWSQWEVQKTFEVNLMNEIQKKDDLIQLFEQIHISCIASKQNGGDFKYYFYCQEKGTGKNYLM